MIEELRYERKYYITDVPVSEVVKSVKHNTAGFSEIFHQRQINNIYFDTHGFESYYDNIDGSYNRVKARIRWYGNTFGKATQPVLELKIKKGLLGYKKNYYLPDMVIDSNLTKQQLIDCIYTSIQDELLKSYLKTLQPVLLNVYTRNYFISFDGSVRLTLDMKMHYYKISNLQNLFIAKLKDENGIVVELKYDKENEINVTEIASQFPFLLTKNSKYLQGLNRIGLF